MMARGCVWLTNPEALQTPFFWGFMVASITEARLINPLASGD